MTQMPTNFLRYTPHVEIPDEDESKTQAELVETLLQISHKTYEDGGHALRSVHAKSHGLLRGKLIVSENLPASFSQGLFANAGEHPVVMRFSTSPGDILPDSVSTPRGLAIKIFDVEGGRLPGSEDATTQDFLLVTGKAFLVSDAKEFVGNLKLLAATTDKAQGLKVALSAALRTTEAAIEALGGESAKIKSLGGYPEIHILGESFFSQVPIRYGDHIAKIGVLPVSPELTRLTNAALDLNHDENALRNAVGEFFANSGGIWEVRAQLCTNLADMPVEDASVPWPEEESPYVTVARIEVPPQNSYSNTNYEAIDTGMSFNPWHCLAAHQPLGSIMRARKPAYEASVTFRLSKNGCPFTNQPA
jgi:hypothetical protein